MAVTRSTAAERARNRPAAAGSLLPRKLELAGLLFASLVAIGGIALVCSAKRRAVADAGQPLNLNGVGRAEQLLPHLTIFASPYDRQFAARRILAALRESGGLPNVGALARIGVTRRDFEVNRRLEHWRGRIGGSVDAVPLLTSGEIRAIKPAFAVRAGAAYGRQLLLWAAVLFLSFYAVHVYWIFARFRGGQLVLPVLHLLTGLSFLLMASLRDPLRDTLAFVPVAQGAAIGCAILAIASRIDYERLAGRLAYVPLLLAFLLSAALIVFGYGPTGSDAKINLLGFQPVELIKILIVFFLAGYFATRWELLRNVPRMEYIGPLVAAIALCLAFFFLQKDLGPALVVSCVFLLLLGIARNSWTLSAAGFGLMLAGFATGYLLRFPRTVASRVEMWISPWDNAVRGGAQVVSGLWGMATGGFLGTGPGLGDPQMIPAAHTDLVLAALGEELGWVGVAAVLLLYAALVAIGIRIALRASTDYRFFLALGLSLLTAVHVLLMTGAVLGLAPLSGIGTPFLSYGRSGLLANFAIFGVLLALSAEPDGRQHTKPFRAPVRLAGIALVCGALALAGRAAYIQIVRGDAVAGAGALTMQADGFRRFEYNPRLLAIAASIPRGAIYDRNGIPLATSRWAELDEHRAEYDRLGIRLPESAPPGERRFYPLGAAAFHLTGDLRTRANWGARNSSYEERDSAVRLQGYDDRATIAEVKDPRTGKPAYTVRYDYRELLPVLRHRYQPHHEAVRRVLERERDLRMTVDARLQARVQQLLKEHLAALGKEKGAVVAMDPSTGDLLASVNYPVPAQMPPEISGPGPAPELLDRARYGLYPPGSTFKVVTAMAALRKDPASAAQQYECKALENGRVGNVVRGWGRLVRDDVMDKSPHGWVDMQSAMTVSCNAYFAQLAALRIGPGPLLETAKLLGISVAAPATERNLRKSLPDAGYGQGQVVASPLQMARVAATVASGGSAPLGRWILGETNPRVQEPQPVIPPAAAATLAAYMRRVVTSGTGRTVAGAGVPIAGKTGTAEIAKGASHAWFAGFAPYGPGRPRLAFAVLIENGQYGGRAAAPLAAKVVNAARELGLLNQTANP
jgi:cell division protein FtsW (lipid II flippase)